jgi:hypothetical protein
MQYRTISTIQADGHTFAPGELVDFSGEQAAQLLADGAIEPIHAPFSTGRITIDVTPELEAKP